MEISWNFHGGLSGQWCGDSPSAPACPKRTSWVGPATGPRSEILAGQWRGVWSDARAHIVEEEEKGGATWGEGHSLSTKAVLYCAGC